MGLRGRLALGAAALLAVTVVGAFAAAYVIVGNELRRQVDGSLRVRAAGLARFAALAPPSGAATRLGRPPQPRLGGFQSYDQFVTSSGKVELTPGERDRLPAGDAALVAAGKLAPYFSNATVAGTPLRIYTTRLRPGTAVQLARPLTEVDHVLSRLRLLFLIVSLVAVAGAGGIALLASRAALRPVRRLTEHAERIAETGDLGERTDENRTDELGRLAVAFNTMLDALAASVGAQRQLVADASHELRTPLAVARTNLEVMELHAEMDQEVRRRALAEAIAELREMTHLIDELVELARGDAQVLEATPLRLDHVVEEAVAVAERRTGRAFTADLAPVVVDGSASALARAVANLLDNAVKWGPPGEPVEVVLLPDGTLTVRDHGPGIAAEDLPHVFDRFYRATAARSMPGSGLGLAIVRQTAEALGGTVRAEPAPGGGTILRLRLPVGAAA